MRPMMVIARALDRGAWIVRRGQIGSTDVLTPGDCRPVWPGFLSSRLDPLETVIMEVGDGGSSIVAAVHSDGRLRLAFGSGEEFVGPYGNMPAKITAAARTLLEVAASSIFLLPHRSSAERATVRITLLTRRARYSVSSSLAELKNGRSPLGPLWRAFSDLLGPTLDVLFGRPVAGGRDRPESPCLTRARHLWL